MGRFRRALAFLVCIPGFIFAKPSEEGVGPLPPGNLSLSTSQQISPLVSFGENIVDKGQVVLYLFADAFIGKDLYATDVFPYIVYGIRDDLSILLQVPFSPGNKSQDHHSAGLEDMSVQLEYALYTAANSSCGIQATLVGNVTFPTGSSTKNPPTGFGSTSFFIGSTFSYTTPNWYVFTSPGAALTTSSHGTKFGDQILYQWGFARNIPSPTGWIFAGMLEFDGQYNWKNTIHSSVNSNSGGNVIYMTPSIWISSKRIILQLGVGYPIVQHLFGNQLKQYLSFDFNFGLTF